MHETDFSQQKNDSQQHQSKMSSIFKTFIFCMFLGEFDLSGQFWMFECPNAKVLVLWAGQIGG